VRRRGNSPDDAKDLTQEFFHRLLHRNYLAQVDPRKGKFRSFLLVAMNAYLANEWDRAHALKRGGKVDFIALNGETDAESPSVLSTEERPDKMFEREWALALLERVLARLRNEFTAAGRAGMFDALKEYLSGEEQRTPYAEVATRLQTTEAALKMSVMRMRRRCGELLREEIAHTVANKEQIEEEVRCLFAALSD
jgi:RNA polymerase sigma-70 factor (ECF subfamily)